jgi:hypothetical protein
VRQALHIFRKDVRYLHREIALVLLTALAFAVLDSRSPRGSSRSWLAELALVVAAAFLIGRLMLGEPVPGDRQFWITRPYRWRSLLGAKLLFIAAFVNLPLLLAHLFIVAVDGFPLAASLPGLIWTQILLFAFVAMPFAALATLNAGMAAFIFSQLLILTAAAAIWELLPSNTPLLGGVEWVREAMAALALAAVAVPVMLVQYRSRRTSFSRWFAFAGIAIGAALFAALPWPIALAMQSQLSKEPALASSIRAALPASSEQAGWFSRADKFELHLPVSLQGIPAGTEIRPDALTVSLRAPDGSSARLGIADCSQLQRETIASGEAIISAVCSADPALGRRARGVVEIRGSLYLTLFGNARSQTLPLSDQPANALDGLQCFTDVVRAEWDVYCRSAFRWPSRLIYAKLGHTNANSFSQTVSYSPFPASLNIEPVETRWASAFASGPPPTVRDVTIIVEEPLAHFRRDFATSSFRLYDFTDPAVRYLRPDPIQ